MKTTMYFLLLIISYSVLSCSGDEPVSASLHGDTIQKDGDLVPFLLYQNSPNPFNPSTMIKFAVSQNMHLTLKVYTEDWQEVSTLVDRDIAMPSSSQPSAYPSYMVSYDARGMASGTYYYVLEGGGYKQIRTMRLMK